MLVTMGAHVTPKIIPEIALTVLKGQFVQADLL